MRDLLILWQVTLHLCIEQLEERFYDVGHLTGMDARRCLRGNELALRPSR